MALAVLALFLALIVFSIILNVRDMKWLVDFTDADAKEKLLALKLDGAEIRRYRRRRAHFGRFGSSESLSDYVQIPLEAPLPNAQSPQATLSGEEGKGPAFRRTACRNQLLKQLTEGCISCQRGFC